MKVQTLHKLSVLLAPPQLPRPPPRPRRAPHPAGHVVGDGAQDSLLVGRGLEPPHRVPVAVQEAEGQGRAP